MENKIKVVIWDMGGVLLRSEGRKARLGLSEKYNVPLDELYALVFNSETAQRATVGEIDESEVWNDVGKRLNITGNELKHFQDQFWADDRLDEDLVQFIRSLKVDYKTALLSNAWSGARNVLTVLRPCIDAFHFSIFSCEVGLAKPDPAIYHKMLAMVGVEPQEAIFVDDVQENIDAANKVGIHGIRFIDSLQARRDVTVLLSQTF